MLCPTCKDATLVRTERHGIEVDYCPRCRGVWLDRGELDKIIERAAADSASHEPLRPHEPERLRPHEPERLREPDPFRREPDPYRREPELSRREYEERREHESRRRKRRSFLSDLFDFD